MIGEPGAKRPAEVISASRRMDLPAFHARPFMERVRRGWIGVPHPWTGEVGRVSLAPPEVLGFVFWSRRPGPLLRFLPELVERYGADRLLFQVTITGLDRLLERKAPAAGAVLKDMERIASALGAEALVWRFDPLLLSELSPPAKILKTFDGLADRIQGLTRRLTLSWLDLYHKTRRNLLPLEELGCGVWNPDRRQRRDLLDALVESAVERGFSPAACCEPEMLEHSGVRQGRCVDGDFFERRAGLSPGALGSAPTRPGCGCCRARDIGVYDSCAFGCLYCYAVRRPLKRAPSDPWRTYE